MSTFDLAAKSRLRKKPPRPFTYRNHGLLILLVTAHFVTGQVSVKLFAFVQPTVTAVWLPTGIGLAALILLGYRVWPVIFVGDVLISVAASQMFWPSLGVAFGNTLEGVAACYLINRFAGAECAFESARNVFRFTFICVSCTLISALVGITSLSLAGASPWNRFDFFVLSWWGADAVAALLLTPFLVLVFATVHHRLDRRQTFELTLLIVSLILVCLLAFGPLTFQFHGTPVFRAWMCIPFLIWAAMRFCQLEAAGAILLLFGLTVWGTLHGFGYFASREMGVSLVHLDVFFGVIGPMTMAVAAMVAERRRIEERLLGFQCTLEAEVAKTSQDLLATVETLHEEVSEKIATGKALRESLERFEQLGASVPDVFWLLDAVEERILYVSPAYEKVWQRSRESLYADAHSWLDAVHPEDYESGLVFFDRHSKEDKFEAEYRILRPDGSYAWIRDRAFALRDASGRICRIAGLASDVTERKQLESQLRKFQDREHSRGAAED